jgi:hypothetical protein
MVASKKYELPRNQFLIENILKIIGRKSVLNLIDLLLLTLLILRHMKNLAISIIAAIALISCQDKVTQRYKVLSPVYMTYSELRKSVKTDNTAVELKNPGKIYYWNKLLLINENGKGIHVIDNTNPAQPIQKTFINIPGNVDMSVKNGILYADSYVDLVAISISNLDSIKEVNRIQNVFPYTLPYVETPLSMEALNQDLGVVTGYTEKYVEKDLYQVNPYNYPMYLYSSYDKVSLTNSSVNANVPQSSGGIGIGGSMARFTISGNVLYAINQSSQLIIFNIASVQNPVKSGELYVSWGIETLFPYNDKLFIGSSTGMLIYDISNPLLPQFVSNYSHVKSCDPVVVSDNFAYISLRTGNQCAGTVNQLDIVDISNAASPQDVKSYDMTNPHGLGIDNTTLFVCDGDAGLRIFDIKDKYNLNKNVIAQYPDNKAFDAIPLDGTLLMIGDDGLYQYDYSDLKNIKLLSTLSISKNQ